MSDTPITDAVAHKHSGTGVSFSAAQLDVVEDLVECAKKLERELAGMAAKHGALLCRLNPSIEYVEGTPVGYGEDEIDRLHRQLDAAQSATAPLSEKAQQNFRSCRCTRETGIK